MPDNVSLLELQIPSGTSGTVTAEVPYACDIADITLTTPANVATTAVTTDIQKNGTTILPVVVGTVAALGKTAAGAGAGISASATTLYLEFTGNGQPDVQNGAVLVIGTENLTVTGQVGGSSQVDGPQPVYAVPVTRGANSTTPAVHAAGVAISLLPPSIAIGAKESSLSFNPPYGPTPLLNEGDTITIVTTGPGVAQVVGVSIELVQR